MSIPADVIDGLVATGALIPVLPLSPRAAPKRGMFVTEEISRRLSTLTNDDLSEDRRARLRADLEVFLTQGALYPKYMFWLSPRQDNVWEIRSVEATPSIRVLGRFAARDVFVPLTIEDRAELEGWNTPQWKRAMRTCCQRWQSIFAQYRPLQGDKPSDFFSGTVPGRYFKK